MKVLVFRCRECQMIEVRTEDEDKIKSRRCARIEAEILEQVSNTCLGELELMFKVEGYVEGSELWSAERPEWWNRLHRLWTKAVGTSEYDKREWSEFEDSIVKEIGRSVR